MSATTYSPSTMNNLFNNSPYSQQSPSRVALSPRQVPLTNTSGKIYPNAEEEQKRLRRNQQAKERRQRDREAKGLGNAGQGRQPLPLTDRVASARAKGKILDVSLLSQGGNAKTISTPQFLRKRFGDLNLGIVSNNEQSYQMALQGLGMTATQQQSALQMWRNMMANPVQGGGRARGPQKSPEEKKMMQRQYRLTSQANKKLQANPQAQLSADEASALRISNDRKAEKERAKLLKQSGIKTTAPRATSPRTSARNSPGNNNVGGQSPRGGVLSPRSRANMNNLNM
jgi:hypothetical protein